MSDFYERHRTAIDARLDREIVHGMRGELPSLIASSRDTRPSSERLHDVQRAVVEDVVAGVLDARPQPHCEPEVG